MHPIIYSLSNAPTTATSVAAAKRLTALGFSHVLFRPESHLYDPYLPENLSARLKGIKGDGIEFLMRVSPDSFDLQHSLVEMHPLAFSVRHQAEWRGPIDPRHHAPASGHALARLGTPEFAQLLSPAISSRLDELLSAGLQGFVFERLNAAAAPFYADLLKTLRRDHPDLLAIAATPGLPREGAVALSAAGFDHVLSSLGWWDFQSRWLVDEYEALRHNTSVMAHITHDAARRAADPQAAMRLLNVAAATGTGMIVPQELVERFDNASDMLKGAITRAEAAAAFDGPLQFLTSVNAPVTAILKGKDEDLRSSESGLLILINRDLDNPATLEHLDLSAGYGLEIFEAGDQSTGLPLRPLSPGEARILRAQRAPPILNKKTNSESAMAATSAPRIVVDKITPSTPGSQFPVKRVVGELLEIEATIYGDGHEEIAAELLYRPCDEAKWRAVPLEPTGVNDLWTGAFRLERLGRYEFTVQGWIDLYHGFTRDLLKKRNASVAQAVDLLEGRGLIKGAAKACAKSLRPALEAVLVRYDAADSDDARMDILLDDAVCTLMQKADQRPHASKGAVQQVDAERMEARFSSWYELFPRSATDDPARHGTFKDVIEQLPAIREMGFDTLYFPPIHPIGQTNRKGKNNTLDPAPDDVGSPYAIGNSAGGHDALHPELGTFEDFAELVAAARANGLEIALDFAINCSPDHPWLKEHPEWFEWRPDGTVKYAENPPKKYQDIVNVDFYAKEAMPDLWLALRDVILFWVDKGVKTFRVDNPHTKPLPFWEWMIGEVRAKHPDVIFLSEAFTRPNVMYRLAQIGFSQSYSYFTWRNTKYELTEYFTELTTEAPREFFRPHLFVNTPDINPAFLQHSGRAGFQIRAVLAATLSGLFGVYSGFEFCEAAALPGKEEYLDSEKYQIRVRDPQAPGNIKPDIAMLNRLRRGHPALQTHLNTQFYNAFNDNIIYYGKPAPDGGDMILVAVLLDPNNAQEANFEIPLWDFGLPDDGALDVEDLTTGDKWLWQGKNQFMRLDPGLPYRIWRVEPARPRHV